MNHSMDLASYFTRVGLAGGTLSASTENLQRLHQAQVYSIPFENFDVALGRPVHLDLPALEEKLVHQRRGGYCFELNGLFRAVLEQLGYSVVPLLGRVHLRGDHLGRTHLLLLVTIENQQWVADVGFGGGCGLITPERFQFDKPFQQQHQRFRYVKDDRYGVMFQLWWDNNHWKNIYSFDFTTVDSSDIALGNYFTSTSPSSLFTQSIVATKPTPNGRLALLNRQMKIVQDGVEQVLEIEKGPAYFEMLREQFGLALGKEFYGLPQLEK